MARPDNTITAQTKEQCMDHKTNAPISDSIRQDSAFCSQCLSDLLGSAPATMSTYEVVSSALCIHCQLSKISQSDSSQYRATSSRTRTVPARFRTSIAIKTSPSPFKNEYHPKVPSKLSKSSLGREQTRAVLDPIKSLRDSSARKTITVSSEHKILEKDTRKLRRPDKEKQDPPHPYVSDNHENSAIEDISSKAFTTSTRGNPCEEVDRRIKRQREQAELDREVALMRIPYVSNV